MSALTKQEEVERRFTILEEQGKRNNIDHKLIMETVNRMDKKLDEAIEKKVDKTDFTDMRNKQWMVIMAIITSFIGLIIYELQRPK
jgi:hypothetical protein